MSTGAMQDFNMQSKGVFMDLSNLFQGASN